jgi:hypothetical protein
MDKGGAFLGPAFLLYPVIRSWESSMQVERERNQKVKEGCSSGRMSNPIMRHFFGES